MKRLIRTGLVVAALALALFSYWYAHQSGAGPQLGMTETAPNGHAFNFESFDGEGLRRYFD